MAPAALRRDLPDACQPELNAAVLHPSGAESIIRLEHRNPDTPS